MFNTRISVPYATSNFIYRYRPKDSLAANLASDFFRLNRLTEKVLERILGVKVDSMQRFWVLLEGESSESSLAWWDSKENQTY